MPRQGLGHSSVDIYNMVTPGTDDPVWKNKNTGQLMVGYQQTRSNLLLQSQTFKTTWTTNNAAIPNDLYKAPDNSLTAQAITATSSGASNVYAQQEVATTTGKTYTYSAHVKKAANGFVLLLFFDGNTSRTAYFNTVTGAATNTSNILTSSFDKMDEDWFRVSITFQNTVTTSSSFVRIFPAAAAGSTTTGASFQAGTELLYIWGAQLEENSEMSAYIVTTNAAITTTETLNDTSETWDFDSADLMPEADPDDDGVWEVPANIVLNGDYEELSSELVTNRDFASDTIWTKGSGWTIGSGVATCDGTNSALLFQSLANTTTNDTFKVTYTISNYVSGSVFVGFGSGLVQPSGTTRNANGTYTQYLTKTSTSTSFGFKSISFVGSIDNVLVKEVDPNDRWTLTNGWSISDGKATNSGSGGLLRPTSNSIGTGTTVVFKLTVSDRTTGYLRIQNNGSSIYYVNNINANGTFEHTFTTIDANGWVIEAVSGFDGKIDNVTVKEYAITPLNV